MHAAYDSEFLQFVSIVVPQFSREFFIPLAGVGDDPANGGKCKTQSSEQSVPSLAVRGIRRLDPARDRESERTDEDVRLRPSTRLCPSKPPVPPRSVVSPG